MRGLEGRDAVARVAHREITQKLHEKSFLISTGVTAVIIVLVAVVPALFGAGGPTKFELGAADARSVAIAEAASRGA